MRNLLTSVSRSTLALVLTSAFSIVGGEAAFSQVGATAAEGEVSTADGGTQVLDEVVVTSRKRAENVQDVPQSIQVLTGDQLERTGVREFTDLNRVAPSLVIRPAEHPFSASVSLRGIGTFAFAPGVERSVAVQVDDVPLSVQGRAFSDLADIERIEVLRGPQSTLYGKSASAGLINIVTRGPSDTFTGDVRAVATTDEEYGLGVSLAGPITETLGYRISANYSYFDGNVRNLFNGEELNGRNNLTTRAKIVWEPNEDLTMTLGFNTLAGETDIIRPFVRLSPNARLRGDPTLPASVFMPGVVAGPENTTGATNFTSGTESDAFGQSLKIEYALGDHTLVSVTSHDWYKLNDFLDQDFTIVPRFDNRQIGVIETEQLTQEVRLLSPGDLPLRYTLGAFFSDVEIDRPFFRGPVFALANWRSTNGIQQKAVFGQIDWRFLPTTTLTAGLRLQEDDIEFTFLDIQNGNAFFSGDSQDSFSTHRLGIQHEFTRDIMVFATYATGHKGEAYDLSTGFNAVRLAAGPVRPETATSYEIGVKTQFFNRRLTVNATAFDATYDDFQAQGIEFLSNGTSNFRLTNVGRIDTRGVEVDAAARIRDDLILAGSVAYLDAEIKDYPAAQCYFGQTAAQGCTGSPARQNLAGFRPPQSPEWKLTASFDYTRPLGSSSLEAVFQGSYTYQSEINYNLSQDPEGIQKEFSILNLSAGVRHPEGRYEIVAFVNNVLDEAYYANYANESGNFGNQLAIAAVLPRDFKRYAGVRLNVGF